MNLEEIIKIFVGIKWKLLLRVVSFERVESLVDYLGVLYKEVNFGS